MVVNLFSDELKDVLILKNYSNRVLGGRERVGHRKFPERISRANNFPELDLVDSKKKTDGAAGAGSKSFRDRLQY